MIERAYDRGGRSKRLRTIDQKRILDKVAELEVSIGSPTTAREIASALNRENAELSASSPGSSRGITGMQGRSPTFYTTKLVAADLSVLRRKGLVSRELDHKGGSAVYGRTDKAYSRTYGYESPGFKALKEQNAGKWSLNDWKKFDDELSELSKEVDENLLGEIDDRREFRLWKEVNDLRLIQKELETASNTHKSQSELLEAINRPYDRRNSAMFTRSTGTFRQFGGKRFILDDVYGTKDQARYMAGYWRARGMNARVIPVKNGSAIYIRKKGKVQPGISSRRRGK